MQEHDTHFQGKVKDLVRFAPKTEEGRRRSGKNGRPDPTGGRQGVGRQHFRWAGSGKTKAEKSE